VFRQFGVTRVGGPTSCSDVSAAPRARVRKSPRGRAARGARACACYRDLRQLARTSPTCSPDAGLRLPDLTKATQTAPHDGPIPAYLRVSNPVDCGGPPVADRRGRQIIDAILADKNVDIVIVPITGAVTMFSEPLTRDVIDASKTTDKPIFMIWGAPSGTDDTYYKRLLDGGLPTFRTFNNCVAAVRAYADYRRSPRYRSPFATAPTTASRREEGPQAVDGFGPAALGVGSKRALAAMASRRPRRALHAGDAGPRRRSGSRS
jgi:hypothetical protein